MNDILAYDSQDLKNKVGYLASKLNICTLSDLNFCLYLLDDEHLKSTGVPFTWLNYKVTSTGPICEFLESEFIYGIKLRKKSEVIGLSNIISCSGRKWNSNITIIDEYETLEIFDKELIDSNIDIFNRHISDGTWLFALVDTIYHKYTKEDSVVMQWDSMEGNSYTLINWIEHVKPELRNNFVEMYRTKFGQ